MVQVAAALLFALAAGLGVTVILVMLRNNEDAILSALLGEGAFPADAESYHLSADVEDELVGLYGGAILSA